MAAEGTAKASFEPKTARTLTVPPTLSEASRTKMRTPQIPSGTLANDTEVPDDAGHARSPRPSRRMSAQSSRAVVNDTSSHACHDTVSVRVEGSNWGPVRTAMAGSWSSTVAVAGAVS